MNNKGFIYKYTLALAYFPNLNPKSATEMLRRELHNNPLLMQELEAAGYCPTAKKFTPKQVKIIYNYIGEP